jgi:hypothetical protein
LKGLSFTRTRADSFSYRAWSCRRAPSPRSGPNKLPEQARHLCRSLPARRDRRHGRSPGRPLSNALNQILKQPVVVFYRAGAGGAIGTVTRSTSCMNPPEGGRDGGGHLRGLWRGTFHPIAQINERQRLAVALSLMQLMKCRIDRAYTALRPAPRGARWPRSLIADRLHHPPRLRTP